MVNKLSCYVLSMMVHIRAEEPSGKSSGVITGEAAGASKYARLLSERGALFPLTNLWRMNTRVETVGQPILVDFF